MLTRYLANWIHDARLVVDGFIHGRFVAWELMRSKLSESHQSTFLGISSLMLAPVATVCVATMVQHAKVINAPEITSDMPYAAFVLMSMLLWLTFVESISAPLAGLSEQLRSMANASFPVEAVTLAKFGEIVVHFGFKAILIVVGAIIFQMPIKWTVIFMPVALVLMIVFGLGIGLCIAPFNAVFRDVGQSLSPITTFWLFLTPVLFEMPKQPGVLQTLFLLNPVTPLLSTTRELVCLGSISQPYGTVFMTLVSLGLFMLGCIAVRRTLPILLEHSET